MGGEKKTPVGRKASRLQPRETHQQQKHPSPLLLLSVQFLLTPCLLPCWPFFLVWLASLLVLPACFLNIAKTNVKEQPDPVWVRQAQVVLNVYPLGRLGRRSAAPRSHHGDQANQKETHILDLNAAGEGHKGASTCIRDLTGQSVSYSS